MKLSISNIAWENKYDELMYEYMQQLGYLGLEIAPTRLFEVPPYEKYNELIQFKERIKKDYGLRIASMQSIWFGITENIFSSSNERRYLIEYTKRIIEFAEMCQCSNIVFGCPKNRNMNHVEQYELAVEFFYEIGEYALKHNTVIAMEANPSIYNTNFINYTKEAFNIVEEVKSKGFLVNLDLGTVIQNQEEIEWIGEKIHLINHVHVSEPYLESIEKRDLHVKLAKILKNNKYSRFISIEMKNKQNIKEVKEVMRYVKEVFE